MIVCALVIIWWQWMHTKQVWTCGKIFIGKIS